MRLVTYKNQNGSVKPGALLGEEIVDISEHVPSIKELIEAGPKSLAALQGKVVRFKNRVPLGLVELLAPLQDPPRIFCLGLAYRDHAIETHQAIPKVPTIFLKLTSALNGPRSPVILPELTQQADYEAEFAFVIGKGGKHISKEHWEEHVFGYTIMNDVSARDVQMSTTQWSLGKSFDTFAPMGPAIVTKDEIPDPNLLDITLTLNGEVLQHSNTRELIFRVPDLIAYISSIAPLLPGDIISTGTPAGVGMGRNPPRWLRAGETIITEIERIGQLVNLVVAEAPSTTK
jgi:2-keto-4-pentenoate hydratase/2-oxohepta-3-ene-1,7-dioic acid hydratase in catechol pathway